MEFAMTKRPLAVLLAVLLSSALALAQTGATLHARLSSGVVRLGDRVNLLVTVENSTKCELGALPTVAGLALGPVGPPSDQHSESWLNGRRTHSFSRTWVIPVRTS